MLTAAPATSIRFRLTLWYTVLLAVVLSAFAFASYRLLVLEIRQSGDVSLLETADSFVYTVRTAAARLDRGGEEPVRAFAVAVRGVRHRDRQIDVFTNEGLQVTSSRQGRSRRGESISGREIAALRSEMPRGRRDLFVTRRGAEGERRTLIRPVRLGGQLYLVAISRSLRGKQEVVEQMRRAFFLGIPLTLIVASLGGYLLAKRSLTPVTRIAEQAAAISARNLDATIRVPNERDELGLLAGVLNGLLERLRRAFDQQRRLLTDASHELRTPVAILLGESEVALRQHRSAEEYRQALEIIHDEARRMSRLVDDLFSMARAEAGEYPIRRDAVFVEELVQPVVRSLRTLAEAGGVSLTHEPVADETKLAGDEALLRRMLVNLIENAIKHTPSGGRVDVKLTSSESQILIDVEDTGTGIGAEAQPHVFEPFFREDRSRDRGGAGASGAGLGLAIAKWVAESHGGSIALLRSSPGGSVFRVTLPRRS